MLHEANENSAEHKNDNAVASSIFAFTAAAPDTKSMNALRKQPMTASGTPTLATRFLVLSLLEAPAPSSISVGAPLVFPKPASSIHPLPPPPGIPHTSPASQRTTAYAISTMATWEERSRVLLPHPLLTPTAYP